MQMKLLPHSWDWNHQKFVIYTIFVYIFFNDSVKHVYFFESHLKSVIDGAADKNQATSQKYLQ